MKKNEKVLLESIRSESFGPEIIIVRTLAHFFK